MEGRVSRAIRILAIAAIALLINSAFVIPATAQANGGGEQGSANGQPFRTLATRMDQLASDFDAAIADLQSQIDDADADLQAQIDDLQASQAAQDALIAAIRTAVGLLEERVAANEGDIAALQAAVEFQAQLIAALENRLARLEARVAANEEDIQAIILADQAMQELIEAIQGEIAHLLALISANAGDIATLQAQVGLLNIRLANLQSELLAKQDRVLGVCLPGSSIRVINADGTVVCEEDTVSAGVGTLDVIDVWQSDELPGAGLVAGTLVLYAFCPSTHQATGGGYKYVGYGDVWAGDIRLVHLVYNRPSANGWLVAAYNENYVVCGLGLCSGQIMLTSFAKCARVE